MFDLKKKTMAMTQWKSIELVIERLLTPGLILELAMCRCVLGKDNLR